MKKLSKGRRRRAAALAATVWLWTAAAARDSGPGRDTDSEVRETGLTEEVEVLGRSQAAEDVAAFATRLDAAEIRGRGEDLADVLRRVPGARVRDYGGLGSYATLSLRSSTAEQVTVLVDGVPQNRALGGPVDLSSIPATQLESVTVFRGFAPAAYGLGGIGGLVDVRTRAPVAEPSADVDWLAGQLGSQRLAAGVGGPGAGGRFRLGLEALESDGDFRFYDDRATPFTPTDDVVRRRVNNRVEQVGLIGRQLWPSVGSGSLGASVRVDRRTRGVPGIGTRQSTTARLDEATDDVHIRWSTALDGVVDGFDVTLNGFRQRLRFSDRESEVGVGAQLEATRIRGAGLVAGARLSPGMHGLLVRGEIRRESATVTDALADLETRAGTDRVLATLTVEDVVARGRWTVAPSIRWQRLRDDRRRGPGTRRGVVAAVTEDVYDDAWTGKLGAAYAVGARARIRGSVGTFNRVPSLTELFGDSGAVVGNPGLRPEHGTSTELGVSWTSGPRWRAELVGFGRWVRDLIWLFPNSQVTLVPRNVGEAVIRGLEAEFGLRGPWGLELHASGTWQRSENTAPGFQRGFPIPFQPRVLAYAGATWRRAGATARWEVTYVGENPTTELDFPEFRIPERVVHDVAFSHRFGSGLRLGLDVRNLFDREILDVARYPLPSRMLFFHVGWTTSGRPE